MISRLLTIAADELPSPSWRQNQNMWGFFILIIFLFRDFRQNQSWRRSSQTKWSKKNEKVEIPLTANPCFREASELVWTDPIRPGEAAGRSSRGNEEKSGTDCFSVPLLLPGATEALRKRSDSLKSSCIRKFRRSIEPAGKRKRVPKLVLTFWPCWPDLELLWKRAREKKLIKSNQTMKDRSEKQESEFTGTKSFGTCSRIKTWSQQEVPYLLKGSNSLKLIHNFTWKRSWILIKMSEVKPRQGWESSQIITHCGETGALNPLRVRGGYTAEKLQ